MHPTLQTIPPRILIGMRIQTTLATHNAGQVWRAFRPRVREIANRIGTDFYAVQAYPVRFDSDAFTLDTPYDTWATVEASSADSLPEGMETFELPGGLYAAFVHHGPPELFPQTAHEIFQGWMPDSGYMTDQRPHFEVISATYRPNDPDAEEMIWVPVREKAATFPEKLR